MGYEGDAVVDLARGGAQLLVGREGLAMHMEPVSEGEWRMLTEIQRGVALDELCSRLQAQCAGFHITSALGGGRPPWLVWLIGARGG